MAKEKEFLIRLVLTEIQAFKNEKKLQRNVWKCGQIRTRVRICPYFHTFLCKSFSNCKENALRVQKKIILIEMCFRRSDLLIKFYFKKSILIMFFSC